MFVPTKVVLSFFHVGMVHQCVIYKIFQGCFIKENCKVGFSLLFSMLLFLKEIVCS